MRFESDAGCYSSIAEMNQARRDMLQERLPDITKLRETLFSFDVDSLCLAEEFVQREKFAPETVSIYFQTTKEDLERMVDSGALSPFSGLRLYISDGERRYLVHEGVITPQDNDAPVRVILLGEVWKRARNTSSS